MDKPIVYAIVTIQRIGLPAGSVTNLGLMAWDVLCSTGVSWSLKLDKPTLYVTHSTDSEGRLEFAGLENDGVEQEQTYILHTMKNVNVYDM